MPCYKVVVVTLVGKNNQLTVNLTDCVVRELCRNPEKNKFILQLITVVIEDIFDKYQYKYLKILHYDNSNGTRMIKTVANYCQL